MKSIVENHVRSPDSLIVVQSRTLQGVRSRNVLGVQSRTILGV